MLALSSSAISCQPPCPVGKRFAALSSLNIIPPTATMSEHVSPSATAAAHRFAVDTSSNNNMRSPRQGLSSPFEDASSPQQNGDSIIQEGGDYQKPQIYSTNAAIDSERQLFESLLKPRISQRSSITLRSFAATALPTGSTITERSERRRSKRYSQPAGRYRTTPITLEEIREVDEELYSKQQQQSSSSKNDDDDQQAAEESATTTQNDRKVMRRYSLDSSTTYGRFGGAFRGRSKKYFAGNGVGGGGTLDFKCTYLTKTKLLPGRALWSSNYHSMTNNNVYRPRSQESLIHMPTIPEEWRQYQQQQQQQQNHKSAADVVESKNVTALQQSNEAIASVEEPQLTTDITPIEQCKMQQQAEMDAV